MQNNLILASTILDPTGCDGKLLIEQSDELTQLSVLKQFGTFQSAAFIQRTPFTVDTVTWSWTLKSLSVDLELFVKAFGYNEATKSLDISSTPTFLIVFDVNEFNKGNDSTLRYNVRLSYCLIKELGTHTVTESMLLFSRWDGSAQGYTVKG